MRAAPADQLTDHRLARAPAGRACGSISRARRPSRAARNRFSASTSAPARSARGRISFERRPGQRLNRARSGCALSRDRRLRVHHPDLDRSEPGCKRTSHHKKLGSGSAPDAISASTASTYRRSTSRTSAGGRCAGSPGRSSCASRRTRSLRRARTASWPTAPAAPAPRCRRPLSTRIASSGSGTPTCTCSASVGSLRASIRIDSATRLYRGARDTRASAGGSSG